MDKIYCYKCGCMRNVLASFMRPRNRIMKLLACKHEVFISDLKKLNKPATYKPFGILRTICGTERT